MFYLFIHPSVLRMMLLINAAGTVYGYVWYWNQLTYTAREMPGWLLPFVPDSPTASLFFTIALIYLIWDQSSGNRHNSTSRAIRNVRARPRPAGFLTRINRPIRGIIEALAVITSIKYGIWAVVMIFFGYAQGNPLGWDDWMLVGSHLGMAVEVLIYIRFFTMGYGHIAAAAVWAYANDVVDYRYEVFPWLPSVLYPYLAVVERITVGLTVLSTACAIIARKLVVRIRV